MKKTGKTIFILLVAILLAGGGIFVGMHWNDWFGKEEPAQENQTAAEVDTGAVDWEGEKEVYTGKKNVDTIDIPGFDSMSLKANTKEQSVNLYNPEANTCYFRISLLLEDGTKLWESGLVEPGKGVYTITLQQELAAGDYENATLKYECFAMDEAQTPLNGSEIKLTMHVLE